MSYYETLSSVYPEGYRAHGHLHSELAPILRLRQSHPALRQRFQGLGATGCRSRALTVSLKLCRLCEPSQNGEFAVCPQRQRLTAVRPPSPKGLPSWSTISKSPSTRSGPLLKMVTFAAGKGASVDLTGKSLRNAISKITMHHAKNNNACAVRRRNAPNS